MNLLDLFILIPIVWLWIRGISKGLIIELATLVGMALGIVAAYYFSGNLQDLMKDYFSFTDRVSKIIAYIVIFLIVWIIVYLIGKAIEKTVDMMAMGWFNKILGGIFGLAKGIIIVCIILFIIDKTDTKERVIKPHVKEKSMFYQPLMEVVDMVTTKILKT
jgi:membrane protein required for colicin V production